MGTISSWPSIYKHHNQLKQHLGTCIPFAAPPFKCCPLKVVQCFLDGEGLLQLDMMPEALCVYCLSFREIWQENSSLILTQKAFIEENMPALSLSYHWVGQSWVSSIFTTSQKSTSTHELNWKLVYITQIIDRVAEWNENQANWRDMRNNTMI